MDKYQQAMYEKGKADALDLRERSPELDGTAIIDEEEKIPAWSHDKDYSTWPAGSPVRDEDQVWTLIQPHNASSYEGRPSTLRALWGLCHTKNPDKAKTWVDPLGTSGMYMKDECYHDEENVYQSLQDNLVYNYQALPSAWKIVKPYVQS